MQPFDPLNENEVNLARKICLMYPSFPKGRYRFISFDLKEPNKEEYSGWKYHQLPVARQVLVSILDNSIQTLIQALVHLEKQEVLYWKLVSYLS